MDNLSQRFVTGCGKRIFVNPSLGCRSSCSYCYLADEGFSLGTRPELFATSRELIDIIEGIGFLEKGRSGSIISIGCYSECWDSENVEVTKNVICYFLRKGNPVQIATKRSISPQQIAEIIPLIQWEGQFSIFISSTSLSEWKSYEKGTTAPDLRFRYIDEINDLGVKCYLYVKPVIENVTIRDVDRYLEILRAKSCGVVVGALFDNSVSVGNLAPISSISGLHVVSSTDEDKLKLSFEKVAKVYCTSVEAIEYWRSQYE